MDKMTLTMPRLNVIQRYKRSMISYRIKARINRWRRAWRYARGTWTADDGNMIAYESHEVTGCYPLEFVDVDGVIENALMKYQDSPKLLEYAERATARVYSKWNSTGDIGYSAQEWALELIEGYASDDNYDLQKRED